MQARKGYALDPVRILKASNLCFALLQAKRSFIKGTSALLYCYSLQGTRASFVFTQ